MNLFTHGMHNCIKQQRRADWLEQETFQPQLFGLMNNLFATICGDHDNGGYLVYIWMIFDVPGGFDTIQQGFQLWTKCL